MKKNEKKNFSKTNRIEYNFLKLKCIKSKANTVRNFNLSRNSFLKNKNKTSSNYSIYKNGISPNNISQDNTKRNEGLFKNEMNSVYYRKSLLSNSVQFDSNFFKRLSKNKIMNKILASKTCDIQNYYRIFPLLNVVTNKKRKIDFIKYKFFLGQKNYYKRLFEQDDFSFSSYYSKKINPYLRKNPKRYLFNVEELKNIFAEKDNKNIHSIKNDEKNFSISSVKCSNINSNKKNNHKKDNYTTIKIKKLNMPSITKRPNKISYENNEIVKQYEVKVLKKNKTNKEHKEHKEYIQHIKSKGQEKIIDDNYNKYLNNISSSESNKSKNEIKNKNKKNHKVLAMSLRPLKSKLLLNDKSSIYEYGKRSNKNNISRIMINNKKKLFNLKYLLSNKRKNIEDICKSIVIENAVLRKKIMPEKIALK